MDRIEYGQQIEVRLRDEFPRLKEDFAANNVQSCYVDNLLSEAEVVKIHDAFPDKSTMLSNLAWRKTNKSTLSQPIWTLR